MKHKNAIARDRVTLPGFVPEEDHLSKPANISPFVSNTYESEALQLDCFETHANLPGVHAPGAAKSGT